MSTCELISLPATIPQNIILKILPSNFLKSLNFLQIHFHSSGAATNPASFDQILFKRHCCPHFLRYKVTKKCENCLMNMKWKCMRLSEGGGRRGTWVSELMFKHSCFPLRKNNFPISGNKGGPAASCWTRDLESCFGFQHQRWTWDFVVRIWWKGK